MWEQKLTIIGVAHIFAIVELIITFRRHLPSLVPAVATRAEYLLVVIFAFGVGFDVIDLLLGLEG